MKKIISKRKQKNRKQNKGIVTIPFLLVLIIILFFTLSLFGLAMTFVHISVSQYMSYSTARKLFLADDSEGDQKEMSLRHYSRLRKQFFSSNAHTGKQGDWFSIEAPSLSGRRSFLGVLPGKYIPEFGLYKAPFYGVGFEFSSNITKFQIPGLVKEEKSVGFPALISSFLGKEPSKEDCIEHNQKILDFICDEYPCGDVGIGGLVGEIAIPHGDNGC